jgi:hypothetical protein
MGIPKKTAKKNIINMKIPGLDLIIYLSFVGFWIWFSRTGLEVAYIGLITKIDLFTVSMGRFNKCLELDTTKPRKTPLNNIWRYFSFIRDYLAMMSTWKIVAQLFSVIIYNKMTLEDISIVFLTFDFVRLCIIDLVIIWSLHMLSLLDSVSVVTRNVAPYKRYIESMEFLHELRLNINADLQDKQTLYLVHILKNAYTGKNGDNTNFLVALIC